MTTSPEEMIWGDVSCPGPDSKYMMFWGGKWRPVTNMLDGANMPTTLALRAVKAVLFVELDYWVATTVSPGDIVERYGRDPQARRWEVVR